MTTNASVLSHGWHMDNTDGMVIVRLINHVAPHPIGKRKLWYSTDTDIVNMLWEYEYCIPLSDDDITWNSNSDSDSDSDSDSA